MDHLTRDLRTALRSLRRSPGFAAVVVVTLALGIGANTAIFTLLDQVVLRPLPVPAAEALVQLDGPGAFSGRTELDRAFSYPMFRDLSAGTGSTATLIARASASVVVGVDGSGERAAVELLSGNAFETLGVTPALGRFFSPADDTLASAPVVVLSDAYWERRFNSAPAVVGQQVRVNTTAMTVIGVARPGFTGVVADRVAGPVRADHRDAGHEAHVVGARRTAASAGSTSWPGWRRVSVPRPPRPRSTCATARSTGTS